MLGGGKKWENWPEKASRPATFSYKSETKREPDPRRVQEEKHISRRFAKYFL